MKVVLLKDVPKLGRKYDVKDVSDGHGRNFLIRNGLAELATAKSLKMVEDMKGKINAERSKEDAETEALLAKLSKVELKIKGKANDEGHLFAGIKNDEIAAAIHAQAGLSVESESVKLDKPIKTTGNYDVEVSIGSKKTKIKITVDKE